MTFSDLLMLAILMTLPGLALRASFAFAPEDESIGEALFSIGLASMLVSGWLAMLLAEFAAFSLAVTVMIVVVASVAVVAARRRSLAIRFPNPRLTLWGVAVVLLLSGVAWLFFRPNDYILGGRDHGVYVNTGATIARTGGFQFVDPVLAELSPVQREALTEKPVLARENVDATWHAGTAAAGYYLFDLDSPVVTPHGFPLYPTWFAILNAAGGVGFSQFLTPLLASLSLGAIILAVRRTFGRSVALLGAGLIAVNLAQLWYARTPSAEIMVQFLFWAGAWAWVRAIQRESSVYALMGGLAWGQIHLAKIEYVALPLLIVAWLAWAWWTGRYRRFHTIGLLAYMALGAHALLHGALIAASYIYDTVVAFAPRSIVDSLSDAGREAKTPFDLATQLLLRYGFVLVVLVALSFVAWIGLRRIKGRGTELWARLMSNQWVWSGLAIAIIAYNAYAYIIRPQTSPSQGASIYVELSWYLGLWVMALGTIGWARRMGQADEAQGFLMWSMFGLSVVFLAVGSFVAPDHFWAARRFVPIIFPGFLLLASDAVLSLLPQRWRDWRQALLPLTLIAVMSVPMLEADAGFVSFIEQKGATDQVRALSEEFEANAVLLFDRGQPSAQIGTPLAMLFERSVAFVDRETLIQPDLAPIIEQWLRADRPVYYLTGTNKQIDIPRFSLDYLRTSVVAWPAAEVTVVFRPQRIGELAHSFDVYRVLPKQEIEEQVITLDVGREESESSVSGVYNSPQVPGLTSVQWTTGSTQFTFDVQGRPRKVWFRLGGRPSVAGIAEVDVLADGELIGHITLQPGGMSLHTVRFPEDAPPSERVVVELRMSTWNPHALGFNADKRNLGVMIDWAKLLVKRP